MIATVQGVQRHRRSIAGSELAKKHKHILRSVYRWFQALHFSFHGPYFQWETVHRVANARLLIDAARRALGAENKDFLSFKKDVENQIRISDDEEDTVRYPLPVR